MDHSYSEETGVSSDLFSEAAAIPPQGAESTASPLPAPSHGDALQGSSEHR